MIDNDGSLVSIDEGEIGKERVYLEEGKVVEKHLTNAIMGKAYSDIWSDHWGKKAERQADEKVWI